MPEPGGDLVEDGGLRSSVSEAAAHGGPRTVVRAQARRLAPAGCRSSRHVAWVPLGLSALVGAAAASGWAFPADDPRAVVVEQQSMPAGRAVVLAASMAASLLVAWPETARLLWPIHDLIARHSSGSREATAAALAQLAYVGLLGAVLVGPVVTVGLAGATGRSSGSTLGLTAAVVLAGALVAGAVLAIPGSGRAPLAVLAVLTATLVLAAGDRTVSVATVGAGPSLLVLGSLALASMTLAASDVARWARRAASNTAPSVQWSADTTGGALTLELVVRTMVRRGPARSVLAQCTWLCLAAAFVIDRLRSPVVDEVLPLVVLLCSSVWCRLLLATSVRYRSFPYLERHRRRGERWEAPLLLVVTLASALVPLTVLAAAVARRTGESEGIVISAGVTLLAVGIALGIATVPGGRDRIDGVESFLTLLVFLASVVTLRLVGSMGGGGAWTVVAAGVLAVAVGLVPKGRTRAGAIRAEPQGARTPGRAWGPGGTRHRAGVR